MWLRSAGESGTILRKSSAPPPVNANSAPGNCSITRGSAWASTDAPFTSVGRPGNRTTRRSGAERRRVSDRRSGTEPRRIAAAVDDVDPLRRDPPGEEFGPGPVGDRDVRVAGPVQDGPLGRLQHRGQEDLVTFARLEDPFEPSGDEHPLTLASDRGVDGPDRRWESGGAPKEEVRHVGVLGVDQVEAFRRQELVDGASNRALERHVVKERVRGLGDREDPDPMAEILLQASPVVDVRTAEPERSEDRQVHLPRQLPQDLDRVGPDPTRVRQELGGEVADLHHVGRRGRFPFKRSGPRLRIRITIGRGAPSPIKELSWAERARNRAQSTAGPETSLRRGISIATFR